jgi:hypothetical protein
MAAFSESSPVISSTDVLTLTGFTNWLWQIAALPYSEGALWTNRGTIMRSSQKAIWIWETGSVANYER